MDIRFDLPENNASIIKVIGVGGGGCNAVNNMYTNGIIGVNFLICNTDAQVLTDSPIPNQIQLGPSLTKGMGAGAKPEVGRNATIESLDELKQMIGEETKMVFITAGMGGGTGTGGAPIVAKTAREMDILTVGIVTTPFIWEGPRRIKQAQKGIEELREHVDTLIIISNDKLRDAYGNMTFREAFLKADDVLLTAAKGIAEVITIKGYVNVDFEDVNTVMRASGVAIMGTGVSAGEDRALQAVKAALASPLLNDNNIRGAKHILLNITSGKSELLMDEIAEITNYIQEAAGFNSDIIWGNCSDDELDDKLSVTIIATGFETNQDKKIPHREPKKIVMSLEDEVEDQNANAFEPVMKIEEVDESTSTDNQFEFTFETKMEDPEVESVEPIEEKTEPRVRKEMDKDQYQLGNQLEIGGVENPSYGSDKVSIDRKKRLRNLSFKLHSSGGLKELEEEPAYRRRNIDLEEVPASNENNISRFSLIDEEMNGRPEIKKRNPFIHDNVD